MPLGYCKYVLESPFHERRRQYKQRRGLLLCGGSSAFWRQMLCDLFALPVQTSLSSEGASLGAAVLAAVGAGIYESVPSACKAMVKYNPETQQPNVENTEKYRHYHKFYQTLYSDLKDRFSALASI